MRNRAFTATLAGLAMLIAFAAPALADTEHVLFQPQMDWRLAIVFSVVGLVVFGLALRGLRRPR